MLKELFSFKNLIEKVIGLIALLLLALISTFYHFLVTLLSKVTSETLAKVLLIGSSIFLLLLVVLVVIIFILYSQVKEAASRYEFVFYFGARWRIQRSKKLVYEKPFCACPDHDPLECKLVEYNEQIKYRACCPTNKNTYDYNIIRLRDLQGKEISIEQAVTEIKKREFG